MWITLPFLCLAINAVLCNELPRVESIGEPRSTFPFRRAVDRARGSVTGSYVSPKSTTEKSDIRNNVPGEPGIDYAAYTTIPKTNFTCTGRTPGYYADENAGCQVFHVCTNVVVSSFLCPTGSLFNQKLLTCDWWQNVNCSRSGVQASVISEEATVDPKRPFGAMKFPESNPLKPNDLKIFSVKNNAPSSAASRGSDIRSRISASNKQVVRINDSQRQKSIFESLESIKTKPIVNVNVIGKDTSLDFGKPVGGNYPPRNQDSPVVFVRSNPNIFSTRFPPVGNSLRNVPKGNVQPSYAPTVPTVTTTTRQLYSPTVPTALTPSTLAYNKFDRVYGNANQFYSRDFQRVEGTTRVPKMAGPLVNDNAESIQTQESIGLGFAKSSREREAGGVTLGQEKGSRARYSLANDANRANEDLMEREMFAQALDEQDPPKMILAIESMLRQEGGTTFVDATSTSLPSTESITTTTSGYDTKIEFGSRLIHKATTFRPHAYPGYFESRTFEVPSSTEKTTTSGFHASIPEPEQDLVPPSADADSGKDFDVSEVVREGPLTPSKVIAEFTTTELESSVPGSPKLRLDLVLPEANGSVKFREEDMVNEQVDDDEKEELTPRFANTEQSSRELFRQAASFVDQPLFAKGMIPTSSVEPEESSTVTYDPTTSTATYYGLLEETTENGRDVESLSTSLTLVPETTTRDDVENERDDARRTTGNPASWEGVDTRSTIMEESSTTDSDLEESTTFNPGPRELSTDDANVDLTTVDAPLDPSTTAPSTDSTSTDPVPTTTVLRTEATPFYYTTSTPTTPSVPIFPWFAKPTGGSRNSLFANRPFVFPQITTTPKPSPRTTTPFTPKIYTLPYALPTINRVTFANRNGMPNILVGSSTTLPSIGKEGSATLGTFSTQKEKQRVGVGIGQLGASGSSLTSSNDQELKKDGKGSDVPKKSIGKGSKFEIVAVTKDSKDQLRKVVGVSPGIPDFPPDLDKILASLDDQGQGYSGKTIDERGREVKVTKASGDSLEEILKSFNEPNDGYSISAPRKIIPVVSPPKVKVTESSDDSQRQLLQAVHSTALESGLPLSLGQIEESMAQNENAPIEISFVVKGDEEFNPTSDFINKLLAQHSSSHPELDIGGFEIVKSQSEADSDGPQPPRPPVAPKVEKITPVAPKVEQITPVAPKVEKIPPVAPTVQKITPVPTKQSTFDAKKISFQTQSSYVNVVNQGPSTPVRETQPSLPDARTILRDDSITRMTDQVQQRGKSIDLSTRNIVPLPIETREKPRVKPEVIEPEVRPRPFVMFDKEDRVRVNKTETNLDLASKSTNETKVSKDEATVGLPTDLLPPIDQTLPHILYPVKQPTREEILREIEAQFGQPLYSKNGYLALNQRIPVYQPYVQTPNQQILITPRPPGPSFNSASNVGGNVRPTDEETLTAKGSTSLTSAEESAKHFANLKNYRPNASNDSILRASTTSEPPKTTTTTTTTSTTTTTPKPVKTIVKTEFVPSLSFSFDTDEDRQEYVKAVLEGILTNNQSIDPWGGDSRS